MTLKLANECWLGQNVDKDKKGGLARAHKKWLEVINDFSINLDLIDAWRVLNPESSRFTWRQKKPEVHCRLDFLLVNQITFCNTGQYWKINERFSSDSFETWRKCANFWLGTRIKEVEDQHLYLEAYSRRENLKFENIPEDDASREYTELVLRSFLERDLGSVNAASVEIQRVHRLGKKKEGKPRPILARFLRFKDCQSMLA